MTSNWVKFSSRRYYRHRGDLLACVIVVIFASLYAWLTSSRFLDPIGDQGWYMQVAARVAAGEVIYRDMLWAYGPLPVYVLSFLFRLLGVNVATTSLLYQILGALACLLTYRIARFLLSVPWALIGTIVVFVGGSAWNSGGLFSYILSYTGAVPFGAVFGLLFLVALLSYLNDLGVIWLVAAGVATGGAFLTKPEFALACGGTGSLFLIWIVFFPTGFTGDRAQGLRALATYVVSTAIPIGIGYGVLVYQTSWSLVWAGISGYEMLATWSWSQNPLESAESWLYIISGLGVYLVIILIFVWVLSQGAIKKHMLRVWALAALGLVLFLLPWGLAFLFAPRLLPPLSSKFVLMQEGIRVVSAPGTFVAMVLGVTLATRWFRAYRSNQVIARVEWFCGVLIVYSILVNVRFLFNPVGNWLPQSITILFPVLVFSLVALVPEAFATFGWTGLRQAQAQFFLAVILLIYAGIGLVSDVRVLGGHSQDVEWATPRGKVHILPSITASAQWRVIEYILSYTQPEDSIVALEFHTGAAGFYFLTGRENPLRQDLIIPGIGSSPADVSEIVQCLEAHPPRLVVLPRRTEDLHWMENDNTSELRSKDIFRQYSDTLIPVLQYVHERYRVLSIIEGEQGGYTVYIPAYGSP